MINNDQSSLIICRNFSGFFPSSATDLIFCKAGFVVFSSVLFQTKLPVASVVSLDHLFKGSFEGIYC